MKALTLYPEHAEAFIAGLRDIETRSWATNYRGPLLLHASLRDPDSAAARRDEIGQRVVDAQPHGRPLTRGAVVASCRLVGCVPIIDPGACEWHAEHPRGVGKLAHAAVDGQVVLHDDDPDARYHTTVTDQLPYGDFTPGRFAWLLEDVKPTTERCPACWGEKWADSGDVFDRVGDCPTCEGSGSCDPIPAKGRQGLWECDLSALVAMKEGPL